VGIIYCLHATNRNLSLDIADENFVFAMTWWFEIALFITVLYLSKKHYSEEAQGKISFILGVNALVVFFGGLLFFGIFWIGTPPLWISDLFVQFITITAMACMAVTPKKGDFTMGISMIFPLMATIVYLCYRF
jgi:hypothetical protein